MEFNISLCSTIIEPQFQEVNVSSNSPLTERSLTTDNSTQTPDPTNLLQWLGVLNQSMPLVERSLFTLDESDWYRGTQLQLQSRLITRPLMGNPMGQFYKDKGTTYRLCFFCPSATSDNPVFLHPVHTALVLRSLEASGPAKALEAFWTLVYQSYYYDTLPFFDYFENATYTSWTPVLVPVRYSGFVAVSCLAVTHLLLVFGIFAVFIRQTRFSKLHDPWLAYTQVWHGELTDVLDEVTRLGLADPAKFLESQNRGDEMVGLNLDVLERAVGVRKRENKLLATSDSSDESD